MSHALTDGQCTTCGKPTTDFRGGRCRSCYNRDRKAGILCTDRVDAVACQEWVRTLVTDYGWSQKAIARASGLNIAQVNRVLHGYQKMINRSTEAALLGVDPDVAAEHLRNAWTTRARRTEPNTPFTARTVPVPPPRLEKRLPPMPEEEYRPLPSGSSVVLSMVIGGVHTADINTDDPNAWKIDALCSTTDPDSFFPEKGGSTREVKKVCDHCPVVDDCLEYALAAEERYGIWGGKSARERRKILYQRKGKTWPDSWKEANG